MNISPVATSRSLLSYSLSAILVISIVTILGFPLSGNARAIVEITDFNGDGYADLAIGVPLEDIGKKADAGLVNVIYGSANGTSATGSHADQVWSQDISRIQEVADANDHFGAAIATGDFNRDGYSDLVIGVPGEDLGINKTDAGGVAVIYGSKVGLQAEPSIATAGSGRNNQFWHQDSGEVEGVSENGDQLGLAVAVGDFNGDGFDDLAMSAPFEDVKTKVDVGTVNIVYGAPSGLAAHEVLFDQIWSQDTAGIIGVAEKGDNFGASLATGDFNKDGFGDLAIGVTGEDLVFSGRELQDLGAVHIIFGSAEGLSATFVPNEFLDETQGNFDRPNSGDSFGFSLATGDFNNDGHEDLAVGGPYMTTGSTDYAGQVWVYYGSANGLATSPIPMQRWAEDRGLGGHGGSGEQFGYSITAGDFNNDGFSDLAAGVPHNSRFAIGSGAVFVLYGTATGLTYKGYQEWTQDKTDIEDMNEDNDHFGSSLSSCDFNGDGYSDLAIGVPHEDIDSIVDAGAVNVIYGSSAKLAASAASDGTGMPNQFWNQDSPLIETVAENGDSFASSVGSSGPK